MLFVVANAFPIVGLDAQGHHTSTTLFGTVRALHEGGMTSVAGLVFVTTIVMPALNIGALLYMLLPLKLGRVPHGLPAVFRVVDAVRPWGMVEVFMLGTLKSADVLAKRLGDETTPELNRTLEEARRTLKNAESTLATESPLQTDLRETLRELTRAAASIRALADSLERQPQSLIRGKLAEEPN